MAVFLRYIKKARWAVMLLHQAFKMMHIVVYSFLSLPLFAAWFAVGVSDFTGSQQQVVVV